MSSRPQPPSPQAPGTPPTDRQIATHIAERCSELRHLAKHPRFRTVSYLLDMARIEAERMAKEMPD